MSPRTKAIVAAALVATLALVALPLLRRAAPAPVEVPAPADLASAPPTALAAPRPATAAELAAQLERWNASEWGRDPFAPPAPPPAAEAPEEPAPEAAPPTVPVEAPRVPRLSGISRRGAEQWAILDHELVRAGDALSSGHRVTRIEARSVTLLLHDEELTLTLGDKP